MNKLAFTVKDINNRSHAIQPYTIKSVAGGTIIALEPDGVSKTSAPAYITNTTVEFFGPNRPAIIIPQSEALKVWAQVMPK